MITDSQKNRSHLPWLRFSLITLPKIIGLPCTVSIRPQYYHFLIEKSNDDMPSP